MKKTLFFLAALMFVFLLFSMEASALSLSGKKLSPISYIPGETISNHYIISDTDKPVRVSVDKGIFSNISVSEVVDYQFDLIIHFTEKQFVPTGVHTFALTVAENGSDAGTGIGSQATVSKNFEVIVYSYEKEIQASLDMPSINIGKNATAKISVASFGYADISELYAVLSLSSETGKELERKMTEKKSLPGLGSISFSVPFQTDAFPAGTYHLFAQIHYDGKEKSANTSFLIGNIDLTLVNATNEFLPGFNDFSAKVKSLWGNPLHNVYLKLLLNDDELLQTPSIELGPREEAELKAILKVDLVPALYQGKVLLLFEGESKEIPFPFVVASPPPEPVKELPEKPSFLSEIGALAGVLPLTMVLLIALIVLILVFLLRKEKKQEDF